MNTVLDHEKPLSKGSFLSYIHTQLHSVTCVQVLGPTYIIIATSLTGSKFSVAEKNFFFNLSDL